MARRDDDGWQVLALLLENGWPGDFDDVAAAAYRTLLGDFDTEQLITALRTLVRKGGTFRPSASEIAAAVQADPGRPTWSEAYTLLFGQRGFLTVRPEPAAIERADARHPLLAAFIRCEGYHRLRMLQVHHPEWGEKVRRDLQRAWEQLERRGDDRRAAGLELDGITPRRQLSPRRPDYLKELPGVLGA